MTTTNKRPIICSPIRTPEKSQRIQAHTVPTFDEYIVQIGDTAAYIAIRARTRLTGLAYLQDLAAKQSADRRRESIPAYAAESAAAMAEHDTWIAEAEAHKDEAKNQRTQAQAVAMLDPAAHAAHKAAQAREEAAEAEARAAAALALAYAQDIDKAISDTSTSDRADAAQEARAAYLEAMQGSDWSDNEQREKAMHKAISAAGAHLHMLAAAKGHPHTVTKLHNLAQAAQEAAGDTMTAEEAEQQAEAKAQAWRDTYGAGGRQPFAVRGGMTAGYITIEKREATKSRAAGWYEVRHYKTYAPRSLDEAYNISTPGGIHDPADVDTLLHHAKLSERERKALFILAAASGALRIREDIPSKKREAIRAAVAKVIRAGLEAVQQHQAKTAQRVAAADTQAKRKRIQREADKQQEGKRLSAMLAAALEAVGVQPEAQRMAASRLRAKIENAMQHKPQEAPQAAEERRPDLIAAMMAEPQQQPQASKVIKWRKHYPKPQPITAEERAAEEQRRAEAMQQQRGPACMALALEMRREVLNHTHNPSRSAWAALDAMTAAAAFVAAMTEEDLHQVGKAAAAEAKAERERKARTEAAAKASGVYGLNTSFKMWQSWTEEQREEHRRFLASL